MRIGPLDRFRESIYPELTHVPKPLRGRVWQRAAVACRHAPVLVATLLALVAAVFATVAVAMHAAQTRPPAWLRPALRVEMVLSGVWLAVAMAYPYVARRRMRSCLLRAASRDGIAVRTTGGSHAAARRDDDRPSGGQPDDTAAQACEPPPRR